jgi:small subunit ribosomal protein S6
MQDNLHLSAPGLIHDVCRGQSRGKEESPYMRNYEVVSIFQPDLDETALNAAIEKVKGWVTESGGSITKVDVWGRRRMAYMIRKTREGQYAVVYAQMDPAFTNTLERNLRFHEPLMRFMITLVD